MTNPKVCKFCKMPIADGEDRQSAMGGYGHSREAWCIRAMQTEIAQLRGNLTLAEDGLANYALEVERLQTSLKRHEPVSLYNGHDIDWWKAEAERLQAESDAWDKLSLVQLHRKLAEKQETIDGWVHANGPGGWIDELRQRARGHHEPLSVGASVTYTPRYASQLPRGGWTIDQLPPEPTYVIRHPEGAVIAVSAGEIQAAVKSEAAPLDLWTCDECAGPPRPYEEVQCIMGNCKPVRTFEQ